MERWIISPHNSQNLFYDLRRDDCGESVNVANGVVLNYVCPNNVSLDRVQMRNRLAYRHSPRLPMRYTRSKRRIKHIHIKGDVNRPIPFQLLVRRQSPHLHHFHSELSRLLSLMPIHGPYADLHQSLRQARFHDPREGTRMREPVSLEFVIQIGMRIEVQNRQFAIPFREGFHQRISDRVIAAERDWSLSFVDQFSDLRLDYLKCVLVGEGQIPAITIGSRRSEVHAELRPIVRSVARECFSNLSRCLRGPA